MIEGHDKVVSAYTRLGRWQDDGGDNKALAVAGFEIKLEYLYFYNVKLMYSMIDCTLHLLDFPSKYSAFRSVYMASGLILCPDSQRTMHINA